MSSKLLVVGTALFSALATAQFSIDRQKETQVVNDVNDFESSLATNSAFASDISVMEKVIPTSVVQALATDPANAMAGLAHAAPSLLASIPTGVADSLTSMLAKPINAITDIGMYVEQLFSSPGTEETLQALGKDVPVHVQNQIEDDPSSFLENLLTATTVPKWITALPAPIQTSLASVLNEGLSIIADDFEGKSVSIPAVTGAQPTGPYPPSRTGADSQESGTFAPKPIGVGVNPLSQTASAGFSKTAASTGLPGASGNTPPPPGKSSSPAPFTGAASSVKMAAAGLAVMVGGAAVYLNV